MARIKLTKKDTTHGNLILVNHQFPLVEFPDLKDMVPLMDKMPEIRMEATAANLLLSLLEYIHCNNEIIAVSGFRTKEEQETIWKDTLKASGSEFTRKFVAIPGCSEHQTGLAVDLAENEEPVDSVCPSFPDTGIFHKFREAAPRYGFIERYLAGKELVTGIGAEPWHFRYVGYPHSVIIEKEHMVLEEYISFLKENTNFEAPYIYGTSKTDIEISYIPLSDECPMILNVPDISPYMISGTNEGGIILSVWREKYGEDIRRD